MSRDEAQAYLDRLQLGGAEVRLTVTIYPPMPPQGRGCLRVRLWIGGEIVAEGNTIDQTINLHREKHEAKQRTPLDSDRRRDQLEGESDPSAQG